MVCSLKEFRRQFRLWRWALALLIVTCGTVGIVCAQLGNFEDLLEGKLAAKKSAKAEFTATLTPGYGQARRRSHTDGQCKTATSKLHLRHNRRL